MILVIDIGNSNVVLGIYSGCKMLHCWRKSTNALETPDEIGIFIIGLFNHNKLDICKIEGVVIESVVPQLEDSFAYAIKEYFKLIPLIVNSDIKTGISIKYDNPKELGTDRLVNAVAAYELYGGPVIVIDFGTATKFCAVSDKGEHLGGIICPGIKVSAEALSKSTAKLPVVDLHKPASFLCRNTVTAIQGGIIFGFEGIVKYIITEMKKELGYDEVKVVATGGLAQFVCANNDMINTVNNYLTLDGLRIIYEKTNR